jgi:di/tricarboxylate transporter
MRVIGVATIDEQSRRLPTDVYSARKGHSIFISHCAAFLVLMVYKWAFKSASAAQVLLLALVVYGLTPLWTNGVDQRSDSISLFICGTDKLLYPPRTRGG